MTPHIDALDLPVVRTRRRVVDFIELTKPRVMIMILVTTLVGFYLAEVGTFDYLLLAHTLAGTALAAGGTLALNQWIEREADAKMQRTRLRPLPDGRLQPIDALVFGAVVTVAGLLYLAVTVNHLSALVTGAISASYLFAYTPLKQRTSLCSTVGAIPGALPPVIGWAAVRGTLDLEAWVLFAIMFLWQLPHSLAIGWLYRDDYARAGFRLLPVVDHDGWDTSCQVVANCLALLAVALLPTIIGLAGPVYFYTALLLGGMFLWSSINLARSCSDAAARRLLFASLIYLPVLLAIMALDKVTL